MLQCYNDYGDIIKATLSKAREINKQSCAMTMELAMQALFTDARQRHKHVSRQLPEMQELKVRCCSISTLARRVHASARRVALETDTPLLVYF